MFLHLHLNYCSLLSEIPAPEEFRKEKLRITPLEFEKDDDTNGHIDFIVGMQFSFNLPNIDGYQYVPKG